MHATKCSKARNMLGPKMLGVVGQQVCIYMGLKIEPSNNKTCLNPGLLFNSVVLEFDLFQKSNHGGNRN